MDKYSSAFIPDLVGESKIVSAPHGVCFKLANGSMITVDVNADIITICTSRPGILDVIQEFSNVVKVKARP